MNLPTFLRKSDELTQQLSKDQLLAVIHEMMRMKFFFQIPWVFYLKLKTRSS